MHELNQPLHAVKNYARGSVRRLLKKDEKDEELLSALWQISEEANRAGGDHPPRQGVCPQA